MDERRCNHELRHWVDKGKAALVALYGLQEEIAAQKVRLADEIIRADQEIADWYAVRGLCRPE
jgi:signal transduction protein with GAF and PtsI domain